MRSLGWLSGDQCSDRQNYMLTLRGTRHQEHLQCVLSQPVIVKPIEIAYVNLWLWALPERKIEVHQEESSSPQRSAGYDPKGAPCSSTGNSQRCIAEDLLSGIFVGFERISHPWSTVT